MHADAASLPCQVSELQTGYTDTVLCTPPPQDAERLGMLGIGELVLLFLVFLFTGGALSRLARWALLRRAPGSKQLLWALTDWIKARWAAADPSAAIDAPSVSQKSTGASPSPSEARENEETPPTATGV